MQFVIQGNTYEELANWRDIVLKKAQQNPKLLMLDHDYKETVPQVLVEINSERAADLGISVAWSAGRWRPCWAVVGSPLSSIGVKNTTSYSKALMMTSVNQAIFPTFMYAPVAPTQLIPLDNLVTLPEEATSSTLNRYNRMRAITISANLAPGYSLGEALTFLEDIVRSEIDGQWALNTKVSR